MMIKRHILLSTALFAVLIRAGPACAVEVAPRISDREIVERLTRLEEGQQSLQKQMESIRRQTELRFESLGKRMEERFESLEKRMEERSRSVEERFESLEKRVEERFESLEKHMAERLDAQWNLTLILIAAIFGLIGFVAWDRKTAFRPMEKRFQRIADDLERDLDLGSPEGSRLTRLIQAVRELAPEGPELARGIAETLRRHALLDEMPKKA